MNIIEFFNGDFIELPLKRDEKDFGKFISKIYDRYLDRIEGLEGTDDITKEIKKNKNSIFNSCDSIRNAIFESENSFDKAYSEVVKIIDNLSKYFLDLHSNGDLSTQRKNYYRMRKSTKIFSKEDMFHPKFKSARENKYRYSNPEFPCLYLGGSVFLCWKELLEPDSNIIQVSRLELDSNSNVKILDFGVRPAIWAAMLVRRTREKKKPENYEIKLAVATAVCWPLMAACSIRCQEKKGPIKEYIIPQMVLKWVRENTKDYCGIRYFSTKIDEYYESPRLHWNYVFPAKEETNSGYCKHLTKIFRITEPENFQKPLPISKLDYNDLPDDIIRYKNMDQKYKETDLGHIEAILNSKKATYIENAGSSCKKV